MKTYTIRVTRYLDHDQADIKVAAEDFATAKALAIDEAAKDQGTYFESPPMFNFEVMPDDDNEEASLESDEEDGMPLYDGDDDED